MSALSTFPPNRTTALARLKDFLPRAGRSYAAERNYDRGPGHHTGVSGLSPWLRTRLITEEEVLRSVLAHHSDQAAEKFIQEVFWRTYWKGWLELRPAVWDHYLQSLNHQVDAVQTQAGLRKRWESACLGATDIDCFNAWARELVQTGYLHNHARMWFASIWIFTLRLPWELGADFFLRHLLDGDPASNTLSWRWVAGIQTPGKTYLARTSNISKFTDGRFHPKWQLAGEAPAREAPAPPSPGALPDLARPDPDLRTGLLLHEDDLSPGFAFTGQKAVACAVLAPQTGFTPLKPADHVTEFRAGAAAEAAGRVFGAAGQPPGNVATPQDIVAWAQRMNIGQIVTPYAPVGPVAQTLCEVTAQHPDLRLVRVMRDYDRAAWPLATKGFFPFKKNIGKLLENLR